jgi:hypothetical protein
MISSITIQFGSFKAIQSLNISDITPFSATDKMTKDCIPIPKLFGHITLGNVCPHTIQNPFKRHPVLWDVVNPTD